MAFIGELTVGKDFMCAKARAQPRHGHDVGRYGEEGGDVRAGGVQWRRGVAGAHAARSTVQGPPTSRTGARAQLTDRRSSACLGMCVRQGGGGPMWRSGATSRAWARSRCKLFRCSPV
jgi:hypothetical protein